MERYCHFLVFLFGSLIFVPGGAFPQESPYAEPKPIDVREGYSIEKLVLTERKIPVLCLSKDEFASDKKPVVILIHGGGMPDVQSKSNPWAKEGWFDTKYFDVPYTLADGGIMVALIDHWWAGERFHPEYRDIVKHNYLPSVFRGFIETTKDIPLLIDAFSTLEGVDATRIGVTGRSSGGIVSLMAAAHEPRVTAITSWVGGPDMMEWARVKMSQRAVDFFLKRSPEMKEIVGCLMRLQDRVNRNPVVQPQFESFGITREAYISSGVSSTVSKSDGFRRLSRSGFV